MAENRIPKEQTDADSSGGDEDKGSAAAASRSEYHSARIESMLASRSEFETELEYQTAHSTVHWSELSHYERASSSEESRSGSGESGTGSGDQSGVDHRHYFEQLQRDPIWGGFCSDVTDVVLGKKLGEGAQAVIYEALEVTFAAEGDESHETDSEVGLKRATDRKLGTRRGYVVKVMKSANALEDLQCQWPRGIATVNNTLVGFMTFVLYGALVKDPSVGRNQFGFVMHKHWGDLRRLIDLRMERNNAQGPPFSTLQARWIILLIAFQMDNLHLRGIIHRDLKASNVLLSHFNDRENIDLVSSNDPDFFLPYVADWECSGHVVGTGFWRAPELLQQLKDRAPFSELVFTKEMDVYSFAMTSYEIVTGKLPFEGLPFSETRDAVLDGARPRLPHDMCPIMKHVITSCWHPNPSLRPRFTDLQPWHDYKRTQFFTPPGSHIRWTYSHS